MNRKKQIEELSEFFYRVDRTTYRGGPIRVANYDALALALYDEGYCKQSKGEWVAKHHMSRSSRGRYTSYNTYTCNICGKANGRRKTAFCPHCGAKMGGGAE